MNRFRFIHTAVCCFLFFAFVPVSHLRADPSPALPAKDRMVVVITLDGFPAYYLSDPNLPAPTLRALIQNGSWAKEMTPINPTWTWPNHTTLITGLKPADHGLLFNGALIRKDDPFSVKIDPAVPKVMMVHCPAVYDIAYESGLTTAQVDWVAINDAPTINWAFPERPSLSDPFVKEMIANHALSAGDLENKPKIVRLDQIWTDAAAYLIRQHRPNLLLLHLLSVDSTHHTYGPRTLAGYDAVGFLDSCVKRVIDALRDAGMLDRTSLFVLSDHGFKSVHKQILLKNLLAQAKVGPDVQAIPEGGSAMIYVSGNRRRELLDQVRTTFSKLEGVERVIDETEYPSLGFPLPSADPQMPNLVVWAQPDYAFSQGTGSGEPILKLDYSIGAHGYPNSDPEMNSIFIANGYGIRSGVTLDQIPNISVAPTLAQLLGVHLPKSLSPPIAQFLQ